MSSSLGKGDHSSSTNAVILKGHEFVAITFHIPASCDGCPKPLWGPFRPPPAMECKRCRVKFHKEHVMAANAAHTTSGDSNNAKYGTDVVAPCKVSYDPTTAKEMLLMASTVEEQQQWVGKLIKKIQKSGYKAATLAASSQPSLATLSIENSSNSTSNSTSYRVSPQESIRSSASFKGAQQSKDHTSSQLQDSNRLKASTLPGGNNTLSGIF